MWYYWAVHDRSAPCARDCTGGLSRESAAAVLTSTIDSRDLSRVLRDNENEGEASGLARQNHKDGLLSGQGPALPNSFPTPPHQHRLLP